MVSSFPAKISFIVFLIIALIITLVTLFTPGWKVNDNIGYGLVTTSCNNGQYGGQYNVPGVNPNLQNYGGGGSNCAGSYQFGTWQEKRDYEKVALAFMIIAGVFEIFAIIAALATIKSESRIFVAAPILALIAAISLIIAFAVYAARLHYWQNNPYGLNQQGQGGIGVGVVAPGVGAGGYGYGTDYRLGYSYWLSVVAFVILLITIVVGFVGACVSGSGYSSWNQRQSPPRRQSEVHVVRRKSHVATTNNNYA